MELCLLPGPRGHFITSKQAQRRRYSPHYLSLPGCSTATSRIPGYFRMPHNFYPQACDLFLVRIGRDHLSEFSGFPLKSDIKSTQEAYKKHRFRALPSNPTECVSFKRFLSDSDNLGQVWELITIPHFHFSDEVSSFPSSKGNLFNRYLFCNYFVPDTVI